jgi:sugar lactone lactonase YvrE
VWDDGARELLWVDTAGQVRWGVLDAAGGVRDVAVRPVGEPVAAVALTTSSGWLVAAGGGFRVLDPDGEVRWTWRGPAGCAAAPATAPAGSSPA